MAGSNEMSNALNTLFDRLEPMLPIYVSPRAAIIKAVLTTIVLSLVILAVLRHQEVEAVRRSDDGARIALRIAMIALPLVGLFLILKLKDVFYEFDMYVYNRQHFANIHWGKQYMNVLRRPRLI